MMDYALTIPAVARRAERLHPDKTIVDRRPDGTLHRTTYGEVLMRSRKLIGALKSLGVERGDRVATFAWNHHQHLEAYYGVPSMGAVTHMLNIRLHADELAYVANHAGDSVVIVDQVLLPQFERFRERIGAKHVIVVGDGNVPSWALDYETLIAGAPEIDFLDDFDERTAAGMCYTSGTTGRSKGVLYSHRSTVLHSLACGTWDVEFLRERDTVMAIVPMFHANAWGIPYTALMFGASQVLPGHHLDPVNILDLVARERVTVITGVPTICNALLQTLDAEPGRFDTSSLRIITAGGAAVPEGLIRAFEERHHLRVLQGWGMTETSPVASLGTLTERLEHESADDRYRIRAMAGRPLPFVETRIRGESGQLLAWDGESMGELEVRGAWVSSSYYNAPETADRFTDDGWFRTGDIVSIDRNGYITIRDRSKDVIKSGGEWISSVGLENMIMRHPAVLEAAVIGLRHPKWDERPLALVVTKPSASCCAQDILQHLEPHFPKFWMPNGIEFVEAIPRTSVGKFNKLAMREQYRDYFTAASSSASSSPARDSQLTS
jgi:fatty-acyl-CoA synthase